MRRTNWWYLGVLRRHSCTERPLLTRLCRKYSEPRIKGPTHPYSASSYE